MSEPVEPPKPINVRVTGAMLTIYEGRVEGCLHAIPLPLWQAIIGFHRQASINWSAETVSYHRWSEKEQRYHTLIPFQNTTKHGLHIDLQWTDPRNAELLDAYGREHGEDFLPASSIHTHVNTGAFESGTDAADEAGMPGWHITLGHLITHSRYDFDFRMRLPTGKKIAALVNTARGHKLTWRNLFEPDADENLIHATPGTTDFHHLLTRINPT